MHSISGFYYVKAADCVYECKARGSFRKEHIIPLTGDYVDIETNGDKGTVVAVCERKNSLQRPPVANLDRLFVVVSMKRPEPNLFVTDKLTAFACYYDIEPVVVLSKCDLADPSGIKDIYEKAGFKVICCSSVKNDGFGEFSSLISGKICAFSGNSGVGKSSILNVLMPELGLETNDISDKLGRGRHTTRSVKLYEFAGGYVADTPGFSSLDFENSTERIYKEKLEFCFPEFEKFVENCRFYPNCSHLNDKGCAVKTAVDSGEISFSRYESYKRMYEEVKDFKKYEEKPVF